MIPTQLMAARFDEDCPARPSDCALRGAQERGARFDSVLREAHGRHTPEPAGRHETPLGGVAVDDPADVGGHVVHDTTSEADPVVTGSFLWRAGTSASGGTTAAPVHGVHVPTTASSGVAASGVAPWGVTGVSAVPAAGVVVSGGPAVAPAGVTVPAGDDTASGASALAPTEAVGVPASFGGDQPAAAPSGAVPVSFGGDQPVAGRLAAAPASPAGAPSLAAPPSVQGSVAAAASSEAAARPSAVAPAGAVRADAAAEIAAENRPKIVTDSRMAAPVASGTGIADDSGAAGGGGNVGPGAHPRGSGPDGRPTQHLGSAVTWTRVDEQVRQETAPTSAAPTPTPAGAARTTPAAQPAEAPAPPTPPTPPGISAPAGAGPAATVVAAQAAAGTGSSSLPTQAQLVSQLGDQLARLREAAPGEHVMTMRVTPESFGPVRVVAHLGPEGVRIELLGATEAAREALKNALSDLRRDLAATGLKADLALTSEGRPDGRGGERAERHDGASAGERRDPGHRGARSGVEASPHTQASAADEQHEGRGTDARRTSADHRLDLIA